MKRTAVSDWITSLRRAYYYRKEYISWRARGNPAPPPHLVKQRTIHAFRKATGLDTLVETGTYLGDMVEAQRRHFRKVISIELSRELFEGAEERFREHDNIRILHGDSGELIEDLLESLNRPAIFWLDGHYSGGATGKGSRETPVLAELRSIFGSKTGHVILIDDARLFDGGGDYPTIHSIREMASGAGYALAVKDDIIRLTRA